VTGAPPPPYARLRPIIESRNERDAYALQQERHIVSDSRELTRSEVFEAVTLAESDLFRALQRVPGVGTRDDYTATMWTRGASWDQTRVYFDGMPLYNPTHAGWLFAAVNPEAIGAASFHPGYRSAEWGEGTAAVLDLRSRRGRSGEPFGGNAEVSLVSARLSADGEIGDGKANWLIALRRSYVDLLDGFLAGLADREELQIAYDFSDVAARLDGELGNGWRYEASGILERDHLRGDIPGLLRGNRGRWGNQAGRITLEAPFGPLLARATVGGTNFSTFIVEEDAVEGWRGATLPTLENAIAHRTLALEVQPMAREGSERPWAAGLQLMRDTVTYEGTYSLLGALVSGGTRDPLVHRPYDYGNALAHSALWGERRWELAPRATALTGIRAEFGDSVHNGGRLRLAPRLAVRLGPFTGTTVSGSWSRSYQYIQDIAPAAGPIGPQLHL
ncbi:MAG: TonB-dependent receptor plug domain-containing protein, partial [Gemmatimonadota bacterium]